MALSCKYKITEKKIANCSPHFTALRYINNLETQRTIKMMVNLENLKFLKSVLSGLKIIRFFVEVDRKFKKTANKSASLHTNKMLLSRNRLNVKTVLF